MKFFFVRRVEAPSSLPQLKASSKLDHYHSTIKQLTFNISAGQAHITTQQSGVLNSVGCPPRCEKSTAKIEFGNPPPERAGRVGEGQTRLRAHPTPPNSPSESISIHLSSYTPELLFPKPTILCLLPQIEQPEYRCPARFKALAGIYDPCPTTAIATAVAHSHLNLFSTSNYIHDHDISTTRSKFDLAYDLLSVHGYDGLEPRESFLRQHDLQRQTRSQCERVHRQPERDSHGAGPAKLESRFFPRG